jgi:hypothetical protein
MKMINKRDTLLYNKSLAVWHHDTSNILRSEMFQSQYVRFIQMLDNLRLYMSSNEHTTNLALSSGGKRVKCIGRKEICDGFQLDAEQISSFCKLTPACAKNDLLLLELMPESPYIRGLSPVYPTPAVPPHHRSWLIFNTLDVYFYGLLLFLFSLLFALVTTLRRKFYRNLLL